ncbi:MarR family winged helix-turn-helix transcriptional regulator [Paenibacillus sp. FSL K6-0108]|uniref:MarR family winged helix-turn-helix transcriptional regulator n=1 Tax=Paenibacillus sp. FSL K6-0108 TaxID=2921417 RepID=UPI00324EB041
MDPKNLLKLDDHICFSLYACSRAIFRMYRPLLDDLELTYPQYLVLLVLWDHQECSIKEISEILTLDSGTLTPMLKRMESAKLIVRKRSETDERIVIIQITDSGMALQERAACIPEAMLASSGMDKEEFNALNQAIKKLMSHVENA